MCRHRRNRIEISLKAIACFLSATLGAFASEATNPAPVEVQKFTLAQAQQTAFERNWDLLAAAVGVDAATAQKVIAREFPNPTFSFSSSLINVDNHPSSTPAGNSLWDRSYDTIFAINQLFEIGGKRGSRKASAQAGFEAARAQFLDAKRTLDLGITRGYVTVAQAEENVRVLRQSAATLREEVRIAEVRHKAGEISTADRSQIEITADRFELEAKTAESSAAQARVAKQRPLIIMTPKSLLRLPQATNRIEHLSETQFFPVLAEPRVDEEKVTRLILCTGKIYYDIVGHQSRAGNEGVAVGRVELLYPFPEGQILELVESYPNLREVVWVQEEPRNMGARAFMSPRLMQILPEHLAFGYIGRPERASPGEGYPAAHVGEQNRIISTALNPVIPVSMYPKKKPGQR